MNKQSFSVHLTAVKNTIKESEIKITGSKSESNRLLILQALYPDILIENLSTADDTIDLQKILSTKSNTYNVGHAGTAMRFLTAFFASNPNSAEVVLTGSKRMQERPIKILVDALKTLGADITYLDKEGFPPLKIKGKKLLKNNVNLVANISSQYISALMLIAPNLPQGLEITLKKEVTSLPYVQMTYALLSALGADISFNQHQISIRPLTKIKQHHFFVESDWSAASYFYSLVALTSTAKVRLSTFKQNSLQGDALLQQLYEPLGVKTKFITKNCIELSKTPRKLPLSFEANLLETPDIAQTIVVTCLGLGIGCKLTGLHTLKIKETDRLVALKNEIEKLGGKLSLTSSSLNLAPCSKLNKNIQINTYNDHRMAMSFAPLVLKTPLIIKNAEVVSKSYPKFWDDLEKLSISVKKHYKNLLLK